MCEIRVGKWCVQRPDSDKISWLRWKNEYPNLFGEALEVDSEIEGCVQGAKMMRAVGSGFGKDL